MANGFGRGAKNKAKNKDWLLARKLSTGYLIRATKGIKTNLPAGRKNNPKVIPIQFQNIRHV